MKPNIIQQNLLSWVGNLPEYIFNAHFLTEERVDDWSASRHQWSFTQVAEDTQHGVELLEFLLVADPVTVERVFHFKSYETVSDFTFYLTVVNSKTISSERFI